MKTGTLNYLMLNGKVDEIENTISYKGLKPHHQREDINKLVGDRIEILPDVDTITGEPIIRLFGLPMSESEEYSFYNSL